MSSSEAELKLWKHIYSLYCCIFVLFVIFVLLFAAASLAAERLKELSAAHNELLIALKKAK
jgi:Na+/H+ antiporter NhaC